ncbi:MAG TPA: sterol desaturase family protein [Pyrinomonadaceae bacterium]|jgi:sterol desaturase/sphingolipid hydroxylase (fatty acid hydroxylase superfamily)
MKANVIYGLIVGALIFIPLERLFALRRDQKIFRRGWRTDIIHFLFTRTISDLCTFLFVGFLIVLLHWAVRPEFQALVASQNKFLQFIEAVLIANFGGYLGHRLSHEIPFLWRFHSVHHSISEMDWLAAARVHPLDQIVTKALTIVPLYILGFSKATFGAYIGLAALHAVFIHANVRFKFGPLRWVIGTPEYHHWHHSNDPKARNKNYAGELPLLDLIFGTIHLPKGRMPVSYGTSDPVPSTYFGQMLYPFRK